MDDHRLKLSDVAEITDVSKEKTHIILTAILEM